MNSYKGKIIHLHFNEVQMYHLHSKALCTSTCTNLVKLNQIRSVFTLEHVTSCTEDLLLTHIRMWVLVYNRICGLETLLSALCNRANLISNLIGIPTPTVGVCMARAYYSSCHC